MRGWALLDMAFNLMFPPFISNQGVFASREAWEWHMGMGCRCLTCGTTKPPYQYPRPICPVCGHELTERRQRLVCTKCGRYEEGCCEGGPTSDYGHMTIKPYRKGAESERQK